MGTPIQLMGGTPPGKGVPLAGYPLPDQHSVYLLRGGRYASCVQAGGFSFFIGFVDIMCLFCVAEKRLRKAVFRQGYFQMVKIVTERMLRTKNCYFRC